MNMQASIAAARVSGPERMAEGTAVFTFRFAADDSLFAGHFPSHPLLPGVFQLEMTRAAAEWVLTCRLGVRDISKATFQRPIYPAELVRLEPCAPALVADRHQWKLAELLFLGAAIAQASGQEIVPVGDQVRLDLEAIAGDRLGAVFPPLEFRGDAGDQHSPAAIV